MSRPRTFANRRSAERRQDQSELVVELGGAVPHTGVEDRVAYLSRREQHGAREHGLAALLDQDGGHQRLSRVPVLPPLGIDQALGRHDLAINTALTNVLSIGATRHEAKGAP